MLNKSVDIISTNVTYIWSIAGRNFGCVHNQRILFPHNGETNFIFVRQWRPATLIPQLQQLSSSSILFSQYIVTDTRKFKTVACDCRRGYFGYNDRTMSNNMYAPNERIATNARPAREYRQLQVLIKHFLSTFARTSRTSDFFKNIPNIFDVLIKERHMYYHEQ